MDECVSLIKTPIPFEGIIVKTRYYVGGPNMKGGKEVY